MHGYLKIKVAMSALFSVAILMATPPYRLGALASIIMLAAVLPALTNRSNRWLLSGAFASAAIYGFVIGQLFWRGTELTENGLAMLVPLIPALAFVLVRIFMVEREAA